ncbi:RDD family protein [Streptomyces gilvus]|uniref:RDD family protein n=1 Tax=Streptomyces gilvus TaxID=2920937 RepID=UPI001F0F0114|nr:RDD family protein [Streptomyces sp. CME 23]MCH5671751.1 RDD family protein [Streptomyces sp. CME 23]
MSAPTPAPGDDRPREGYYPDPSIPGYVRYWNGASWVPGTSRPAPTAGEPLSPPAGSSVEETGPHFFDEDPEPAPSPSPSGSGPAPAWGADRAHQSGFGDDHRVSWGADPRVPHPTTSTDGTATIPPTDDASSDIHSDGTFVFRRPMAGGGAAGPHGGSGAQGGPGVGGAGDRGVAGSAAPGAGGGGAGGSTPSGGGSGAGGWGAGGPQASAAAGPGMARAEGAGTASGVDGAAGGPGAPRPAGAATGSGGSAPGIPHPAGPSADEGTMTFRAVSPRTGQQGGAQAGGTGAPGVAGDARTGGPAFGPSSSAGASAAPAPAVPAAPSGPGFGAGKAAAERAAAAGPTALSGPQQPAPAVPQQPGAAQPAPVGRPGADQAAAAAPMTSGPGGGQSSWAQQVHRLAGGSEDEQPVVPWKPPVEDVFQAAARRQAAARPAPLGKRLLARIVDNLVIGAVTAVAAVPLGAKAIDHVNDKIDAAKLSGRTVTVWLLDGTTSVYLGIVLAVLLVFGVLYEALPTARWGRTLGKRLLGLEVRDIEAHEPPAFGAALRRWLVYSVPGVLVIGFVGVLWCLFDRPWHQCWHDKAARTFVAG